MKGFMKDVESESRGKSFSRARNFLCVRLLSQLLSAFELYICTFSVKQNDIKVTYEFVFRNSIESH